MHRPEYGPLYPIFACLPFPMSTLCIVNPFGVIPRGLRQSQKIKQINKATVTWVTLIHLQTHKKENRISSKQTAKQRDLPN